MYASALLIASLAAAPAAEVVTLDDQVTSGVLVGIDGKSVTVESGTIALENVLEIRFPQTTVLPVSDPAAVTLWLRDGGRLGLREIATKDRNIEADTIAAGNATFPLAAVRAIRFRPSEPALDDKWNELLESEPERDVLVVRSGDVLDRLEGTVSGIDAENLTFLVGETRVPIPRTKPKLFGVIFGRSSSPRAAPLGELRFANGDSVAAKSLSIEGRSLKLETTSGTSMTVPVDALRSIDFGRGKVQLLSKLPPREVESVDWFGEPPLLFSYITDRSFEGNDRPIKIDRQTFRTGLVIHSRTKLTWKLGGDFRRLTAVAGIEQARRNIEDGGAVDLTITADGRELFKRRVTTSDPPIPLDLDLGGARELTVLVDFADDMDMGDHLALGDARLIK